MLAYAFTFARLILAGGFALCAAAAFRSVGAGPLPAGWAVALLLLAGAAELTDALDGPAARRGGTAGRLGGLLDPLCDSLSRLTMYFAAALVGWISLAVPLAMAGRDLIVAYVRIIRAMVDQPTSARISGKIKAIIQGLGLLTIVVLAGGGRADWAVTGRLSVAGCVLAVTLWSLMDYLRAGWGAVVELHRRDLKR